MKKRKQVISITLVVTAIAAVAGIIYYYNTQASPRDELKSQWISSGPFAIDKPKYKLGENIFMTVNKLQPNEAGTIHFVRPNGVSYADLPFNGTLKDYFTYYFTPTTSVIRKIHNPEDLVGTWTVIFSGVSYSPLKFEIVNEYIRGGEANVPRINVNQTTG